MGGVCDPTAPVNNEAEADLLLTLGEDSFEEDELV